MNILYITAGVRTNSFEFAVLKQLKKNGHKITIVSTNMDTYTGGKINQKTKHKNYKNNKSYYNFT